MQSCMILHWSLDVQKYWVNVKDAILFFVRRDTCSNLEVAFILGGIPIFVTSFIPPPQNNTTCIRTIKQIFPKCYTFEYENHPRTSTPILGKANYTRGEVNMFCPTKTSVTLRQNAKSKQIKRKL